MVKWQLSEKMTELQLLLREEESLAKNCVDEKTQQALGAHDQHLKSCQQQLEALDTLTHQIRQIQQDSDPIRLLEVVLYGLFLSYPDINFCSYVFYRSFSM